ncbi:MAG: class I SAM-dependent methyltransferase [bacterium]|nr:class I SAM-dependent methyltransferase [bacterium]
MKTNISTKNISYFSAVLLILVVVFDASHVFAQKPEDWEIGPNRMMPPKYIMDAIGVKEGMVIGEIGAGKGRFTIWLAHKVGKSGKIYANDIDNETLEYLKQRCTRDNIKNITTVLGNVTDSGFPLKSLDMAFMIRTYHHLDKPVELLRNIRKSLKPGGTLVVVDSDPKLNPKAPESETTDVKVMLKQAQEAGFYFSRMEMFLRQDNIFIFRFKDS